MTATNKTSLTRRVLTSTAMLGSSQIINMLCSVVRIKLIAVWLGPVGVGMNTILTNAWTLVSTGSQLNLRESSVRELSQEAAADRFAMRVAVVRRWALILGILGAVLMVALSPLFSISAYDGSPARWLSFAALAPTVFFAAYSAGEFAVMQARDRLAAIARTNILAGVIATAASVPLLYFLRLNAIILVINLYTFVVAACVWFVRHPIAAHRHLDFNTLWAEGRGFLTLGLSLSASMMLTSLMNYIFAAYLSSSGGEADLGIYQSGYTMINGYVGIIFSAIAVEYYPRLSRIVGRPSMSRTVIAHELSLIVRLITPVAILFIFFSDLLVDLLYSSQFEGVVPFITFAILGALYRGVSLCFAYRILAAGDSRAYIFTEAVSVIVGLTLNIVFYRLWAYAGLGIAYIVWYAFYAILTAVVCRVRYGLVLPRRLLYLTLASTVIIAAAIAVKHIVFPA